jgi:hypothetical protein
MRTALTADRSISLSQGLLILCLVYVAAAAMAFPQTFLLVAGQYPIFRFFVFVPVILGVGLLSAAFAYRPRAPLAFMREKIAARGQGALIIIATLIVSATAFTTLKHEYSKLVPFFADPALAEMDRMLHFGDPWVWLRKILPSSLDYPLFLLYSVMWFMELLAGVLTAAFLADRQLRERYLATFAVSVILLSSAVRVFASSAGPVLYDRIHGGSRFAELTASLQASPAGQRVLDISKYLHDSYATDTTVLGTGISAMPSLHVAVAFINALFFARLGRLPSLLGWSYFAVILFGSVYFGWHYAIDGYVSIAVVFACWIVSGKLSRTSGTI